MTDLDALARLADAATEGPPLCADCDGDCLDVRDKLWCWLYDPDQGYCPFLRTALQEAP